ncbi:MAG: ketoacyl-ACP synthase III [Deferribacteraceae bacterium]|jgi:3-oxoacyl-[acyl-carrier-protein] synthase-3|nr:ketoacyl-ACP synthase III [Deferribacteraceae bacterium]
MIYAKIAGTGSYFPERILTNDDLSKIVETNDQWIVERTGIRTRHICAENETSEDIGYYAALKALEAAGLAPSDINGVIFLTFTPKFRVPSAAVHLQNRLGIPDCFAFDLNSACTGFIQGISVASDMISTGKYKNILVVSGEKLTSVTNWKDRGTCILFGDAGGAAVLQASEEPGLRSYNMHSDGSYAELLYINDDQVLTMKGNEVFKVAVKSMGDAAEQAIRDADFTLGNIDIMIPHQANIRIMQAVAKRVNLDMEKVMQNIERRGNTSSSTIPTALDEGVRTGRIKRGDNILLAAFAGGFTWAGAVLTY